MIVFPKDYESSWTLANTAFREGICLHTGRHAEVSLTASEKPGFHVSWTDSRETRHTLLPSNVLPSQLCTTLQLGNNRLATVEHLLAALAGCGLTHVNIEVSGEEIPLLDGSALGWVEAISEAGLRPASTPPKPSPVIRSPLIFCQGNSVITATPAKEFSLVGVIDFPYLAIGKQMFSIELNPNNFVQEIAPARTFGFSDQLDQLRESGLIKGGSLQNALVCDQDHWLNPPLRFKDEPVRHKLLDLIGDLALVGFPKAQILVYRGSHRLHTDLAAAIFKECSLS